jgi:hypothetical protein
MPELAYNIVSVSDLQDWIEMQGGVTTRELRALEAIANGVTETIERHTRRMVVQRSVIEYYDGLGGRELWLRKIPVSVVTSLQALFSDGSVQESFAPSDYLLDSERGQVMLWSKWFPKGRRSIKADLSPGWALAVIPSDILLAARTLAMRWWKEWNGGTAQEEIVSQSIDGQSTTFFRGAIPEKVAKILRPYVLPAMS